MIRILAVDDNQSIRELVEITLSLLGDYRVTTVNNGKEGIEALEKEPFDAVITDLDMPIVTGLELLRWIRSRPDCADLPVLVLTAATDVARREELLSAGADAYLVKPFQPDQLEREVVRLLEPDGN